MVGEQRPNENRQCDAVPSKGRSEWCPGTGVAASLEMQRIIDERQATDDAGRLTLRSVSFACVFSQAGQLDKVA